jgi:hypothetical protein
MLGVLRLSAAVLHPCRIAARLGLRLGRAEHLLRDAVERPRLLLLAVLLRQKNVDLRARLVLDQRPFAKSCGAYRATAHCLARILVCAA